jgi:hypothetical protein
MEKVVCKFFALPVLLLLLVLIRNVMCWCLYTYPTTWYILKKKFEFLEIWYERHDIENESDISSIPQITPKWRPCEFKVGNNIKLSGLFSNAIVVVIFSVWNTKNVTRNLQNYF